MGIISAVLRQEGNKEDLSLSKKCPNTEFFLVYVFLYSDHKKLCIWTLNAVYKEELFTFLHKKSAYISRISHQRVLKEKVFLEISQNLQENNCVRVYFLIKFHA